MSRIEIELRHHGGRDNGRLPVTYDDFESYGIDRHSIAPALRELEALGFIEITEHGRAGNAEFRTPSRYRLTFVHGEGDFRKLVDPTHEWRRVETLEQAEELARMARKPQRSTRRRRKNKTPVGENAAASGKNPRRNDESPNGGTPHSTHSREAHTTFDISGRGAGVGLSDADAGMVGKKADDGLDIPDFLDRRRKEAA